MPITPSPLLVPHHPKADWGALTLLCLKMLRRFGYRRIGIFMQLLTERQSHHGYLAALHYFHSQMPPEDCVEPSIYRDVKEVENASPKFRQWLRHFRPDAITAHHSQIITWLERSGYRVPEQIGVAHLAMEDDCVNWAGIWSRMREIGAQTAEQVISQIQNNQFGLPTTPYNILISGQWRFGQTLLTPKPAKAKRITV